MQKEKAFIPISCKPLEKLIWARLWQLSKASVPMVLREEGKVMEVRLPHSAKAISSMVVSPSGRLMEDRGDSQKASRPMTRMESGKVTFRPEKLKKP